MQTPTFEPLATIDDNTLIPQLEYIVKCWDAIYSCGPEMAGQFLDRYNYGHVRNLDKIEAYQNDAMIQPVLMVYGLDPEKFWYLLLMAVDFVDGYGSEFLFNEVPSVQLDKVFSFIEANLTEHEIAPMGYKFVHDPEMKLTLTVKQPGMKNNKKISIDTPNSLAYLAHIYKEASEQEKPRFMNEAIGNTWGGNPAIPQTIKLAVFTKLLYYFLQPLQAAHGILDRDTPIDKYFLISQLAYIMGLTTDEKYINPLDTRHLRDNIKDYEGVNIMDSNQHYNFDILFE